MRFHVFTVAVLATCLAFTACNKKEESSPTAGRPAGEKAAQAGAPAAQAGQGSAQTPPAAGGVSMAEARQLFTMRCAMCHGENGKGDGPAAATLNPRPRNYTDKAWQASVTDEHIAKTIAQGGQAVGQSPLMPANGDLKPEMVNALVKLIRSFAAQ